MEVSQCKLSLSLSLSFFLLSCSLWNHVHAATHTHTHTHTHTLTFDSLPNSLSHLWQGDASSVQEFWSSAPSGSSPALDVCTVHMYPLITSATPATCSDFYNTSMLNRARTHARAARAAIPPSVPVSTNCCFRSNTSHYLSALCWCITFGR